METAAGIAGPVVAIVHEGRAGGWQANWGRAINASVSYEGAAGVTVSVGESRKFPNAAASKQFASRIKRLSTIEAAKRVPGLSLAAKATRSCSPRGFHGRTSTRDEVGVRGYYSANVGLGPGNGKNARRIDYKGEHEKPPKRNLYGIPVVYSPPGRTSRAMGSTNTTGRPRADAICTTPTTPTASSSPAAPQDGSCSSPSATPADHSASGVSSTCSPASLENTAVLLWSGLPTAVVYGLATFAGAAVHPRPARERTGRHVLAVLAPPVVFLLLNVPFSIGETSLAALAITLIGATAGTTAGWALGDLLRHPRRQSGYFNA